MSEASRPPSGSSENSLKVLHRRWAIAATRRFQLMHPELTLKLHGADWAYTVHVTNCPNSEFPGLAEYFYHQIRPATCDMRLSLTIPTVGEPIETLVDYEAELWLHGEALPIPAFNTLLSLAEPGLPDGGIDFDNGRNTWVFRSFNPLNDDEKACVQRATTQVGILDAIDFVEVAPQTVPPPNRPPPKQQGDLTLITSRHLKRIAGVRYDLVQQDEDEWRAFLTRRANQEIVAPEVTATSNFACLYDVERCGDSRLSELLTLYDRVDIVPPIHDFDEWSAKHQVSLPDLQELVRLKRTRIILPYSAVEYPSALIEAVAEVDRSSMVLSRTLAAKTIVQGQMKDPLLYAPLTQGQRGGILSAMAQAVTDEKYRAILSSYGQLFSRQHDMFMLRGALGSLGFGVGAHLGEIFMKLRNKDARMELMACGAGIEWALGLGASYIPRDFGGYEESPNSRIIASFLGRVKLLPADPVADRMHIVTDGLLAVSGVPPLEVARNFDSLPASRFRSVAHGLMKATTSASELQEAVEKINADVRAFERHADRLASWKVGAIVPHVVAAAIDHQFGLFASIGAVWLYEHLEHRVPKVLRAELTDAKAMLVGLATGSSLDTVIVSRSRRAITHKGLLSEKIKGQIASLREGQQRTTGEPPTKFE
jgi:hypothetical protein